MRKYLLIFTVLAIFISFNQSAEAVEVTKQKNITINCDEQCEDKGLVMKDIAGEIELTLHKVVRFYRDNGVIAPKIFNLDLGKSVTLTEYPTTAEWFAKGDLFDSPPANGKRYKFYQYENQGMIPWTIVRYYITGGVPTDIGNAKIKSDNPSVVGCGDGKCTAWKSGTAKITISFPSKTFQKKTTYFFNHETKPEKISEGNAYGSINLKGEETAQPVKSVRKLVSNPNEEVYQKSTMMTGYNFPSIEYTVTVPETPNTPHTSSCKGISDVTASSATVKWDYSDADLDPQTSYSIQIATDKDFKNIVKALTAPSGDVSGVRTQNITGLTPNTTYYARINTYNDANNWNAYSTCGDNGFTTDGNKPQVVTYVNTDNVTDTTGVVHWTYEDPESDAQTQYEVGISETPDFETVQFVNLVTSGDVSNVRQTSFSSLTPNTTYFVRVRAANANNGWSAYSKGQFTTDKGTPHDGVCSPTIGQCSVGDVSSYNEEEGTWTCLGENEGEDRMCPDNGGDKNQFQVGCSVSGTYVNENTIFRAIPHNGKGPFMYYWNDIKGSDTFTKKYTTTGEKTVTLKAEDDNNKVDSISCVADITCDPNSSDRKNPGECVNSVREVSTCGTNGWERTEETCGDTEGDDGDDPVVEEYKFDPYITPKDSDVCPLILRASEVSLCRLTNGTLTKPFPAESDGLIMIDKDRKMPVGTWKLTCFGTAENPPAVDFGEQKCISNPNIKEH